MTRFEHLKTRIFEKAAPLVAPSLNLEMPKENLALEIVLLPIIEDCLVREIKNEPYDATLTGMEQETFSTFQKALKETVYSWFNEEL